MGRENSIDLSKPRNGQTDGGDQDRNDGRDKPTEIGLEPGPGSTTNRVQDDAINHQDHGMPRQKAADQIEALRRQQADIAARLKEAETKAREKKREDDQRRERLTGRCILAQLDREPDSEWSRATMAWLDRAITRPADRALFKALLPDSGRAVRPEIAPEPSGGTFPDEH